MAASAEPPPFEPTPRSRPFSARKLDASFNRKLTVANGPDSFQPRIRVDLGGQEGDTSPRRRPEPGDGHLQATPAPAFPPKSPRGTRARNVDRPGGSPRAGLPAREASAQGPDRQWNHNYGLRYVPHGKHSMLWGRGIAMPSEARAAKEHWLMQRRPQAASGFSDYVVAAASFLQGVVSDDLLSGPRSSNQPSSARCEPWVLHLLRSITDPAFYDEDDDSRLLPALDSWLDARGNARAALSGRSVDSYDEHGVTLLHVASCFGKVHLVRELLKRGADFDRLSRAGRSPVVYACLGPDLPRQKAAILKLLLGAGCQNGLGLGLEFACILGREGEVGILTAHGALPKGQIVTLDDPWGRPDLDGALAQVRPDLALISP